MKTLYNKIREWVRKFFLGSQKRDSDWQLIAESYKTLRFSYKYSEDLPMNMEDGVVYVIGERNIYWALTLNCPCGCHEIIQLNLLKEASPCWFFNVKKKLITIEPSIWKSCGCRSHFHIRNGRVLKSSYSDFS